MYILINNSIKEISVIRSLCGIAIKDCSDRTLLTNSFLDDRIITNISRRYYFSLLDVFCGGAYRTHQQIRNQGRVVIFYIHHFIYESARVG